MVIDTSAVVAVLLNEPDRDLLLEAIAGDPIRLMSSVNALESGLVIEARKGDQGGRELDLLLHRSRIEIVAFTLEQLEEARSFNVPVVFDRYFGPHHSAIEIFVDNVPRAITGIIDREAQVNGTPRVMGYKGLRHYFQSTFKKGEIVDVIIESPQRIRIRPRHS